MSKPTASWTRSRCKIKRKDLNTLNEADAFVESMSGESSTDSCIQVQALQPNIDDINFQRLIDETNRTQASKVISVPRLPKPTSVNRSSSKAIEVTLPIDLPSHEVSYALPDPTVEVQYVQAPNLDSPIQRNFNNTIVEYVSLEQPEINQNDAYENQASEPGLRDIYSMLRQILDRVTEQERRSLDQSVKLDFIFNKIQQKEINQTNDDFSFKCITNEKELNELEEQLGDEEYKQNFLKWLISNIEGECSENRMLQALDLIFSLKFQADCTWTGSSRVASKTAILSNPKLLNIFQKIGTTQTEMVNQIKLADFFKKKLKNATKRLTNTE
ncbi:uncharacterized protein LOC129749689 [Uranotaenia lowii]|uniref:uncharacterized protein LOC129749689 n=1 Tax=Uranotaenia lowii TaxID=190385 RepID=UPI002479E8BC|nr:uncharacterized protein LOC129749689 [Uranotaenia lowii]